MPLALVKAVLDWKVVVFIRVSFQVRKVRDTTIVSMCAGAHFEDSVSAPFALAPGELTSRTGLRSVAAPQPVHTNTAHLMDAI
jgi:hypothetical protein